MFCEACERGDHEQCGMQTWCSCDCEGPDGIYDGTNDPPDGYYFCDDLDGGRLVKKPTVFTHCNVCGRKLHTADEDQMGMCEGCASL